VTNPLITRDDLRRCGDCWSSKDIARRVSHEGVTLRQILDAWHARPIYRVWVACCALPEREARRFACRCARRALEREEQVADLRRVTGEP